MGRDVMDDRKRALVMGKFKFLYQVRGRGGIERFSCCLSGFTYPDHRVPTPAPLPRQVEII